MTANQIISILNRIDDIMSKNGCIARFGKIKMYLTDSSSYELVHDEDTIEIDEYNVANCLTTDLDHIFVSCEDISRIELYVSKEDSDHYYDNLDIYDPSSLPPTE